MLTRCRRCIHYFWPAITILGPSFAGLAPLIPARVSYRCHKEWPSGPWLARWAWLQHGGEPGWRIRLPQNCCPPALPPTHLFAHSHPPTYTQTICSIPHHHCKPPSQQCCTQILRRLQLPRSHPCPPKPDTPTSTLCCSIVLALDCLSSSVHAGWLARTVISLISADGWLQEINVEYLVNEVVCLGLLICQLLQLG